MSSTARQVCALPVVQCMPQVLKYLRQIAVITPYAQFRFRYTAQDDRNSVAITFVRRTLKMPVPPAVRAVSSSSRLDAACTPAGSTAERSDGDPASFATLFVCCWIGSLYSHCQCCTLARGTC